MNIGFFGSSAIVRALRRREHVAPRPAQARRGRVDRRRPHPHRSASARRKERSLEINGFSVATALDEDVLKQIAKVTDGTYHQAEDADALAEIYKSIDLEFKRVQAARGDRAVRRRRRPPARARLRALDRVVRPGDLSVVRLAARAARRCSSPPRSCCLLVDAAPPAQAGRSLLERRAAALAAAEAEAVAAAPPRRPAAARASSRSAVAAGRPHVERSVPYARTSVILAMDVSGSMCSTDVQPNRLAVAQEAAREFVENQPKGVRMALVVFSGFAELTVPADDRSQGARRRRSSPSPSARGTAIGAAMLKGLDAIAEANPDVAPVGDAPDDRLGAARRRSPAPTATCPTSSCS